MSNRLGWVVGALIAVLVALTGVAVHSLVLLGSVMLAVVVGVGGIAAVAALGAAYAMAREAEAQLPPAGEPLLPPEPVLAPEAPAGQGWRVREARPGEIPEAYLAAVMKGAEATRAAQKARAREAGL